MTRNQWNKWKKIKEAVKDECEIRLPNTTTEEIKLDVTKISTNGQEQKDAEIEKNKDLTNEPMKKFQRAVRRHKKQHCNNICKYSF